jgi:hypothetical protein
MIDEYKLQAACVKLFAAIKPKDHGRLFLNLNNPRSASNGFFLKSIGLTAGVADMTLLSNKGVIFLEFKTQIGKQSLSQKWWQSVVEEAGYRYEIIRSVEQFKAIVDESL